MRRSPLLFRHAQRPLILCLAASLALAGASPALAGPADDLQDLVGARGRDGEPALERRGYTHVETAKSNTTSYSYWWSNDRASCVRVATSDGRYQALVAVDPSDCGQTQKETGLSDGAKVAIGAAALLGIAALVHKSHHRDDRAYDARQTAEFERGYRDGLYHNSFHNYNDVREYNDGYNAGVRERDQQSSYRGGSYGRGGYSGYSSVNDLTGQDLGYALGQLDRRGFRQAGERRMGDARVQYFFWNDRNGQCLDVHARDDRVLSLFEVPRYSCNR